MDYHNNIPIYLQVVEDIKRKIVKNELRAGEKLPSNSDLALQYKINPNTVQRVCKELEAENICFIKRGVGTFISEDGNLDERIKNELVIKAVVSFLTDMQSLGYSNEQSIQAIKHYKGE
jgi:DNA-binding transcriptional regulator YhcF (GntR family)